MKGRNTALLATGAAIAAALVLAYGLAAPAAAGTLKYALEGTTVIYDKTTQTSYARWLAVEPIATDGSMGAKGFGVITDAGLDAIIVTTTHAGVLDSAMQNGASDPVYHNHYVKLGQNVTGLCGDNPEVVDLTFQSPGSISVGGNFAYAKNLPDSFNGTSSLSGNALTLTPGHNFQNAVSFDLEPKFGTDGSTLEAVCVTHITPSEKVLAGQKITN